MKKTKLEMLLYKSFDAELTEKESELLRLELQNSKEFRNKYNEISRIRHAASQSKDSSSFEPFFEQRVLNKINSAQKKSGYTAAFAESLSFSFRKFAFAASFVVIGLISYNLISGNEYSINSILGKYQTSIEYAFDSTYNLIWSDI
ncbi:MAG TPA: hypothetical protein VHO43_04190 [Ignavibacteriales bacterium]|jgi:hypothetical protein|nr:hypothetical protein [Ignavibacteriales bacterium]